MEDSKLRGSGLSTACKQTHTCLSALRSNSSSPPCVEGDYEIRVNWRVWDLRLKDLRVPKTLLEGNTQQRVIHGGGPQYFQMLPRVLQAGVKGSCLHW
jgi:hypothetical protein